jgi:hypothetical protein
MCSGDRVENAAKAHKVQPLAQDTNSLQAVEAQSTLLLAC